MRRERQRAGDLRRGARGACRSADPGDQRPPAVPVHQRLRRRWASLRVTATRKTVGAATRSGRAKRPTVVRNRTLQRPAGQPTIAAMVNNPDNLGPAIVIEGTREDWPGGARTLRPLRPEREPNRATFWFGAQAGDSEVWFRITAEAVHRMQEETPRARGGRLIDAWIVWLQANPDHQPTGRSRLRVFVSDDGDTRVEAWQATD